MSKQPVLAVVCVLLAVLLASNVPISASGAAPLQPAVGTGGRIFLRAGHGEAPFVVAAPVQPAGLRAQQSATFTADYLSNEENYWGDWCEPWPSQARTAFDAALVIWGGLVNSDVPIVVEACWTDMGDPRVLGYSGGQDYYRDFPNAPQAATWYTVALANALSGSDRNGADPEIIVAFNSAFDWYLGTSGTPAPDQYDLMSVVLHEVCHGLGFAGSMRVQASVGSWGGGTGMPIAYDRFARNGSGQSLMNDFPNYSVALGTQLRSGDIYFDGPNANTANGGSRPELYAPGTWSDGSSYSHLDESFNGTVNALMTYSLNDQETVHDPGPIAMGMLRDMGWNPVVATAPDVSIVKQVLGGSNFEPGDPITFTLTVANNGTAPANSVRVTDTLPSQVLSASYSSSLSITQFLGSRYVWNVEPLDVGESGVITIRGTINPALLLGASFTNSAAIYDPEDTTPNNNTGSVFVFVGGQKIFLPLVLKRHPPIPDIPVLNAIDNADGDGNYTVSWNASYLAQTYELQEDDNAAFSSPSTAYSGSGLSTPMSGKPNGTHYYRVRASNSWGYSDWSGTQSATVAPPGTLYASADSYVRQGYPTSNYGNASEMWAGYDDNLDPNGQIVRSLVQFDTSVIPAGTPISSAVLRVYMVGSWDFPNTTRTVTTYRANSAWSEYGVTWNSQPGFAEAYGSASMNHGAWGWYTLDVTGLVQGWVNGSLPNYGIMLRGPEHAGSDSSWKQFSTRQGAYTPELVLTYTGAAAPGDGAGSTQLPQPPDNVDGRRIGQRELAEIGSE